MAFQTKLFTIIFAVVGLLGLGIRHAYGQTSSACPIIQEALSDYDHLKVGIAREEVEKFFTRRAGLQFPDNTSYAHPKCGYIHVDVEFESDGRIDKLFSSHDRVTKISKLYIDHPPKD
jgi:hypothetical protein